MRTVKHCQKIACEAIGPIVNARIAADAKRPDDEPPADMVHWIYEEMKRRPGLKPEDVALQLLNITAPAMFTTINSLANVIYHLLSHSEYFRDLRQEVDEIWESCDGKLDYIALPRE